MFSREEIKFICETLYQGVCNNTVKDEDLEMYERINKKLEDELKDPTVIGELIEELDEVEESLSFDEIMSIIKQENR